jgi:hypothetical protein
VHGAAVALEHHGRWVSGTVLWQYNDNGRDRALVRVEAGGGVVVCQLHWCDELSWVGRVLELPLLSLQHPQPDDAERARGGPDVLPSLIDGADWTAGRSRVFPPGSPQRA